MPPTMSSRRTFLRSLVGGACARLFGLPARANPASTAQAVSYVIQPIGAVPMLGAVYGSNIGPAWEVPGALTVFQFGDEPCRAP